MGRLDIQIRHGDGGGSGAVIALIVFIVLAAAGGAGHKSLASAAHGVATAAEVVVWIITGTVIAAAAGGAVYAAVRIRNALRHRPSYRPPVMTIEPDPRDPRCLPDGTRPAIDAPRPAPTWPLAGRWDKVGRPGGDDNDRRLPRTCGAAPAA